MGVGGAGQGKAVVAAFPVILHPETLRRGQKVTYLGKQEVSACIFYTCIVGPTSTCCFASLPRVTAVDCAVAVAVDAALQQTHRLLNTTASDGTFNHFMIPPFRRKRCASRLSALPPVCRGMLKAMRKRSEMQRISIKTFWVGWDAFLTLFLTIFAPSANTNPDPDP